MFHGTTNCFKSVVQNLIGSLTVINIAFSVNQEKTVSGISNFLVLSVYIYFHCLHMTIYTIQNIKCINMDM